jgi:hypothetical protein
VSKTVITVKVDHHAGTKALARILRLLDFCKDAYGITELTYTVDDDE